MDLDIDMNDHGESDDTNGDGEGVWSPDIEQCFREALLLFPPCGRRKHILQEEGGGKMYGRNELIARHIMMRTGKSRTRKQVSSHIQVLARRKAKAEAASSGSTPGLSPTPSNLGSGRVQVSIGHVGVRHDQDHRTLGSNFYEVWLDRPIATKQIRLVEFSAFIEHRNFPTANQAVSSNLPNSHLLDSTRGSLGTDANNSGLTTSASNQDLSNLQANQQMSQSYLQVSQHQTTHPLASNHQLPAQFNQATFQTNNGNNGNASIATSTTNNINQLQIQHSVQNPSLAPSSYLQPQISLSGSTRHSYVQIDYSQSVPRQTSKLERIDISQIQDKFPEIGGSNGLFQRGPDSFFLVKFWADLNNDFEYNVEDQNSYFGFSSHFETIQPYKNITCSTKACSYGLQVVEKVEKIFGTFNSSNGSYSYHINRSPMCEFMIQFIKKLRQLPKPSQMNSVLENFTVLQVITSESSSEILLCLAYVFEVASVAGQNLGPQYHVYKLTKD